MDKELSHSWGPWKNHAYIKKYKNSKGKWVYVYASKDVHRQIKKDRSRSESEERFANGLDEIEKEYFNRDIRARAKNTPGVWGMTRAESSMNLHSLMNSGHKEVSRARKISQNLKSNSDRLIESNSISGRLKRAAKSTSRKLTKAKKKIFGHSSIPSGVVLRQPYENELMHSAKGTTWAKTDHKYIEKVKDKYGIWHYVYKVRVREEESDDGKPHNYIRTIGEGNFRHPNLAYYNTFSSERPLIKEARKDYAKTKMNDRYDQKIKEQRAKNIKARR